ncbi:MAG: hypothetical protein R3F59_38380, partial [Myxococcota bacterium]
MTTLAHPNRVGAQLKPGRTPPDLLVEPMFPAPKGGADPQQRQQQQQGAAPPPAAEAPVPEPLQRFVWVRGRTVDEVRRYREVELAWAEAPPCGPPAFDLDAASEDADADDRLARALRVLHETGTGKEIKLAVIERAWSPAAGARASSQQHDLAGTDWTDAVAEFGGHGDRTVAALLGVPDTSLSGIAPDATVGLFSTLRTDVDGTLIDDLPAALMRAHAWLGTALPGCLPQLLGPLGALLPGPKRGVLLVELQHFLMEPQVRDLDAVARERWCPGGRAAAGPVDADPGIRAAVAEIVRSGHLVVLPAANGRRDLRMVVDDAGAAHLHGDGHQALRVGASHAAGRVAGSNFGGG